MKKATDSIKIVIPAGSATMGVVGPSCGQKGIKAKDFCDIFNKKTEKITKGTPIHTKILIYPDKSFDVLFHEKESTVSLIKKAMNLSKGSSESGKKIIGTITENQLLDIAQKKMGDMNAFNIEQAKKIVMGTASSMGVELK